MIAMELFERKALQSLRNWKNRPDRKPLVIRGARQVGKTTLIKMFAREFDAFLSLNLEKEEERKICDQANSFSEFLERLFFYKNIPRNQENVLIFFDEVQYSQKAMTYLRYFYEEKPNLKVIAAGSLLENVLHKHSSFPVGRVEFLYLSPFTFEEFLYSSQYANLKEAFEQIPLPRVAHDLLMSEFRKYALIGGMPEIVRRYRQTEDLVQINDIYESLLISYMDDIEKYARNETIRAILRQFIRASFAEAATRIKYQGFGLTNYRSREAKEALLTLEKALLVRLLFPTTQTKPPLVLDTKKSPKLLVLDTGLVNYFAGLQRELFAAEEIDHVYQGKIAEHLVGQELLATQSSGLSRVSFWVREKKQSSAEVDYVLPFGRFLIPIEVKSGPAGKLRSLLLFMDQANHPYAVRVYSGALRVDSPHTLSGKKFYLLNLPFYLAGKIHEYLQWFLDAFPPVKQN